MYREYGSLRTCTVACKNVKLPADSTVTYDKNEKVNDFIAIMYENMLHPCITQPTRIIEHQRPSIIDNIFINYSNAVTTFPTS